MKKTTLTIIALIAIGIATMESCKKKDSGPSAKDNLTGTWKISKSYQDTNRNGVMDANELITDTGIVHETIKFTADGWVTANYYNFVVSSKWEFANSDTYLKITDTSSTPSSTYSQIITLSSSALTLKDTTGASSGGITWTYFTKQ